MGLYMSLSVLRRGEMMILEGRCECGGLSYLSTAHNSHALCENAPFWMWNQSLNPCVSFHVAGKTALVRHKAPLQIDYLTRNEEGLIRDMRTYFCFESFQWRSAGLLRTTVRSWFIFPSPSAFLSKSSGAWQPYIFLLLLCIYSTAVHNLQRVIHGGPTAPLVGSQ